MHYTRRVFATHLDYRLAQHLAYRAGTLIASDDFTLELWIAVPDNGGSNAH